MEDFHSGSSREARVLTAEDLLVLFICPQCGQRARVPKRLAGSAIYCPRCKNSNLVTKPAADQSSMGGTVIISRPQRPSGFHTAPAPEPSSESLAALAGTTPPRGSPAVPPTVPPPAAAPPPPAATIPFTCTKCRREAKIPAELAGKVLKCPHCEAVQIALAGATPVTGVFRRTATPKPKPSAASTAPTPAAGTPEAAAASGKTAMVDDRGRIIFACESCTFAAYFAPGYGGKTIQCPFCGATQTIDPLPPGMGRYPTPTPGSLGRLSTPKPGSLGSGPVNPPAPAATGTGRFNAPAPGSLGSGPINPNAAPAPGTARFTTPAPGSLGTAPQPGTGRTQAPGTARFTTPMPGTLGTGPAAQPGTGRTQPPGTAAFSTPKPGSLGSGPVNAPAPGTGRVVLPASSGTGRITRSVAGNRFNTPLPGSLVAPEPGQALVQREKIAPPPTPKPATLFPPTPPPMTVQTASGRFVNVARAAAADPSASAPAAVSAAAPTPPAAQAPASPASAPIPAASPAPASGATGSGTARIAASPPTSAAAPSPAAASSSTNLAPKTSAIKAPASSATATAPAPALPAILVRCCWALGAAVLLFALLWVTAMNQVATLKHQQDAATLSAQTAIDRKTANEQAILARAAQLHAEDDLAAERAAHDKDAAALAATTAQLAAERAALATAQATTTRLQDENTGREKAERELATALMAPDDAKAHLMNNLLQALAQEVAARVAAERQLREAGMAPNATAAATTPRH